VKRLPVIYIYFGKIPEYMIRSIDCAYENNKNIIVLTDTDFKYKKVTCFKINNYNKGLVQFESVYKHMSSNSYEFEKRCIDRWFILRNFVVQENIEVCYYTDSDVMIYGDLAVVYGNYKDYEATYTLTELQGNYRWAASGCCSYWKAETLTLFCNFILETYSTEKIKTLEEKWTYHQANKIAGGICDMTLLYLFSQRINFYSLSKIKNVEVFDHNMLTSENYYPNEYEMEGNGNRLIKKIVWENGIPYGNNLLLNEKIRFVTLTEYAKLKPESNVLVQRGLKRIKTLMKKAVYKIVNGEK
jgi:hypothetical protein